MDTNATALRTWQAIPTIGKLLLAFTSQLNPYFCPIPLPKIETTYRKAHTWACIIPLHPHTDLQTLIPLKTWPKQSIQ